MRQKADSRLIDAAPALLAAAYAALRYDAAIQLAASQGWRTYPRLGELDRLYEDWIRKSEAAVAKAKPSPARRARAR